jgi:two-component system, OmpR family, phosphate regulon sensor histidine kinase PhoR
MSEHPPESDDQRGARALQALIDEVSLGLIHVGPRLTVRAANSAAHRLLERRPGSLLGRSVMEAFVDHHAEELIRAAIMGSAGAAELTVGRQHVLAFRVRPSADGGAWIAIEDVTELRRLQRIRAEFIDNLSHELRTPLSTIRLLTETLAIDLERVDVPQKVRDRVAKIDVETGHLVQMVTEMLDLARMEQASAEPVIADVPVERLLRTAADRINPFAERQGIGIAVEIDGVASVRGDDERLGQLLVNLLHNAIKFSPSGSTVTLRAERRDGEVLLVVRDEGMGIPRADLDRVFERFYKVDRARVRGMGGTGLGLSIARHIAEGHGGRIWAASEEGAGSTFSVALPDRAGGPDGLGPDRDSTGVPAVVPG